jgi:hypothetical protein
LTGSFADWAKAGPAMATAHKALVPKRIFLICPSHI